MNDKSLAMQAIENELSKHQGLLMQRQREFHEQDARVQGLIVARDAVERAEAKLAQQKK